MLSELRHVHIELLEAIAELEALVNAEVRDEAALGIVRYKLTRISGRRRTLVDAVCDRVGPGLEGVEADQFKLFTAARLGQRALSSKHIAAWGLRDIVRDWSGYRAASTLMRAAMREQITVERLILYPLLERAAHTAAAAA